MDNLIALLQEKKKKREENGNEDKKTTKEIEKKVEKQEKQYMKLYNKIHKKLQNRIEKVEKQIEEAEELKVICEKNENENSKEIQEISTMQIEDLELSIKRTREKLAEVQEQLFAYEREYCGFNE